MRIYAIRESWDHEAFDLVEFFLDEADAQRRVDELNEVKRSIYNDYEVEEVVAK
ncbi:MAG TPA: hypothetical protein VIY48_10725 [Candidatus Paceibacterota bacterium]